MRILSVDDNAENLYLIDRLGRAHGHEVTSARNGLEAVAALEKQPFDLIVSDILMPEMDGFQLCHEVKSHERTRRIPFIVYTATYTSKQDEDLALSLGATRFLVKPMDPDEFLAIVEEAFRESQCQPAPDPPAKPMSTLDYLHAYNGRLVQKLDRKIEQLEHARNELQALLEARDREIGQRERAERELKETEVALRASQDSFRRAILEAPFPIAIHADGGRILQLNRAWLAQSGYAAEDLLNMRDWAAKAWGGSVPEAVHGLDALERPTDGCEIPIRTASGEPRTWVFSSAPIGSTPDATRAVITVAVDVTELRSLERQLAQAQKMEAIGQLAGSVAHDFNNMLTVISGYSDLLLHTLSPMDPAAQQVKEISQAAGRAAALTRQLLAFSRKQVLKLANVDINTVVRESEGMLRRLIGENIEIRIACAADQMRALVDTGQLMQVIMNLAVNARDAMPKGGVLTIETSALEPGQGSAHPAIPAGHYVQLAVRDTGIGMDQATLAHMFEPFFTTKAPGAGTGLGLSTVYGIVKQSNGQILVDSEPARGTAFRICLPRIFAAPEPAAASVPATPILGSETVLLVEDEPSLRNLAREILRGAGYRVIEAANGREAIQACEQSRGRIALTITDLVMPGMGGQELAQRLLAMHPEMRVLYMSGYANHAVLAGCDSQGHEQFIYKPFTPRDLTEKVRGILDRL